MQIVCYTILGCYILIGAQSLAGWLDSSMFIATTVILGRLLLGKDLESLPASNLSHSRIISNVYLD